MKIVGQCIAYAGFFALVALLTARPELRLLADDQAIVSLSFSYAAQRIGECTRLSQEELNALPPNMRKPDHCPRERHPLYVELLIDDTERYKATLRPSGIRSDGKATVYKRIAVAAGPHVVTIRMNDSGATGFDEFSASRSLSLRPGQNLVVYFDADTHQFIFE